MTLFSSVPLGVRRWDRSYGSRRHRFSKRTKKQIKKKEWENLHIHKFHGKQNLTVNFWHTVELIERPGEWWEMVCFCSAETEPRASHTPGKCSTPELHLSWMLKDHQQKSCSWSTQELNEYIYQDWVNSYRKFWFPWNVTLKIKRRIKASEGYIWNSKVRTQKNSFRNIFWDVISLWPWTCGDPPASVS